MGKGQAYLYNNPVTILEAPDEFGYAPVRCLGETFDCCLAELEYPEEWEVMEYAGTKYRVTHRIVGEYYGPERWMLVWSPVSRECRAGQECMTPQQLLAFIVETWND